MKKRPTIFGKGDAQKYLGISPQRFYQLSKKYEIPFVQISCGKVYFKEDIDEFQKKRKSEGKLRHRRKK